MITDLGERLALIIDAKTDGAVANIRKLSVEEKAAADRAEVLKAKIADLESRAARSPGSKSTAVQLSRTRSELAGLESTLAQVPAGAGTAERALAKLGLQGTVTGAALTAGLSTAAGGLALFGGFEFLKSGVDNYVHLADEIRAVQFAAQGSAEDASKLVAITTALGVSSDTAALGVFRLGKNISLTPEKLSAYGIAVARDKQGNVDLIGTLGNVADAYQKTQDPARKAAIVYEAFGRAGTTMLPILNSNAEKLKEIASEAGKQGRIFSAQDLANAKEYEITMRELRDSLQAVGIAAGRDLVPALSKAAGILTDISDAVHSTAFTSGFKAVATGALGPLALPLRFLPGGGGGGGRAKALAEQQAQEAATRAQALEQAATATLGGASSILATPGQGLADAKQSLADAVQSLADARAAREKAAADLATVRKGAPGADATSLEAAAARVEAAQARLKAAEYVGGDARIASARATLLTAQKELNKLREQGGTSADKLAAATLRLHKAEETVAAAARKTAEARKAKAQASGFSATDIEDQLKAQLKDKTALANAQAKIVGLGASSDLIAFLDKQNLAQPGTLVKVSKGINSALVAQLNATVAETSAQSDLYSALAGSAPNWEAAGRDRGSAFNKGFLATAGALPFGVPIAAPRPSARENNGLPGGNRYTFTGPITVQAQDPEQFGRKLSAKQRLHALSGASL